MSAGSSAPRPTPTADPLRLRARAAGRRTRALLCAALSAALAGAALADPPPEAPARADGLISGTWFASPETRAIQQDEFSNPGMLSVERGAERWGEAAGEAGKSCADCHGSGAEALAGVGARYPRYDAAAGTLINLGQRINLCRTRHMQAAAFEPESAPRLELEAFVMRASLGMAMDVATDGPAAPFFARGQALYRQRVGQMDLACTMCHDQRPGHYLRAEHISQGHVNGFPAYMMRWGGMASRQRRFQFCNEQARAEPLPIDSPDYNALELYVAWRGNGLEIETPAVRR